MKQTKMRSRRLYCNYIYIKNHSTFTIWNICCNWTFSNIWNTCYCFIWITKYSVSYEIFIVKSIYDAITNNGYIFDTTAKYGGTLSDEETFYSKNISYSSSLSGGTNIINIGTIYINGSGTVSIKVIGTITCTLWGGGDQFGIGSGNTYSACTDFYLLRTPSPGSAITKNNESVSNITTKTIPNFYGNSISIYCGIAKGNSSYQMSASFEGSINIIGKYYTSLPKVYIS